MLQLNERNLDMQRALTDGTLMLSRTIEGASKAVDKFNSVVVTGANTIYSAAKDIVRGRK